jgi:ribosomal protein L16 Arg81 hydroxylase
VPVAPHLADLGAFPKFAAIREHEVRVVVRPGETLILPKGWWHAVLAEDIEASEVATGGCSPASREGRISVNWWWL